MQFNYDTLSQHVGDTLEFTDQAGIRIPLIIDKVEKGKLNDEQWASFSVFYKSDGSFQLQQGHYHLAHETLGDDYIFIVPRDTAYYETMISHKRIAETETESA